MAIIDTESPAGLRLVAKAFNEWMRRYQDDPAAFEAEFNTVSKFREQFDTEDGPAYGLRCADYLFGLVSKFYVPRPTLEDLRAAGTAAKDAAGTGALVALFEKHGCSNTIDAAEKLSDERLHALIADLQKLTEEPDCLT